MKNTTNAGFRASIGALCCTMLLAPALTAPASADVKLAGIFQSHAVLQTGQPVPVWGQASAGENVTVSFAGQTLSTITDETGAWKVTLAPLAVSSTPATLTVKGNNEINLQDVLVGEVWFCSGQSNMEFLLSRTKDSEAEIAAANYPLVRQFKPRNSTLFTPGSTFQGYWTTATPETAKNFSAVGYFFAREVQQKLGVPVAIINSSWGGTEIESWMSGPALAANPEFAVVGQRWQQRLDDYPARKAQFDIELAAWQQKVDEAKAQGQSYNRPRPRDPAMAGAAHVDMPSGIFNGMVAPLTPFPVRGVLWYQGESNAGRAKEYETLFPAMISDWRRAFGQPNLPFYWVQLPNFRGNGRDTDWVEMRQSQSRALALPATGQAITIDVGEANDIHPTNKRPVGERLARLALKNAYGQNVVDSGPRAKQIEFEGSKVRVTFTDVANGLQLVPGAPTGFEVAGADHKFALATATIAGASVLLSAPEVAAPVAVRYAWHNVPVANLTNSEGLPAAPFRSDNW